MVSIKLKLRTVSGQSRMGRLYYQLAHQRKVKLLETSYFLYFDEWDDANHAVVMSGVSKDRLMYLREVSEAIRVDLRKLWDTVVRLEQSPLPYDVDDIAVSYGTKNTISVSFTDYARHRILMKRQSGYLGTADNYETTLKSFITFLNGADVTFPMLSGGLINRYEAFLKLRGNSRNTISFYMRNLRSIYNQAVAESLVKRQDLFKEVYTGVDKTMKRAISLSEINRIKELDLNGAPSLAKARDLFLFSFYARGVSFVDLAFMRKRDVVGGVLIYRRRKTGQQMSVRWEKEMQRLVERYTTATQYLLPIITREDGTEYRQYKNAMMLTNRKLKEISVMAHISLPVSMYVARHSWATIARDKNIPLSVISKGLGHENDMNTQIYLASIADKEVDDANRLILHSLRKISSPKNKRDVK